MVAGCFGLMGGAGETTDGGSIGGLMVYPLFLEDHSNHINSYIEKVVFWSFFRCQPWRAAEIGVVIIRGHARSSAADMVDYSLKCQCEWSWLIGPQGTRPAVDN